MSWWMLLLIILTGLIMVINWLATLNKTRYIFKITKPLALILLIILFFLFMGFKTELLWFYIALVLSLAGDILLMFPTSAFLLGLLAFLFAQIAYIIGFDQIRPPLLPAIIASIIVILVFFVIFRVLQVEVARRKELRKLRLPILIYSLLLSSMAASAVLNLFKPEWHPTAALFAAIGGMLFLASDLMLAYNRFITHFKAADFLVMCTYHLAQVFLVIGVIIQYL